ncbi:MAG TPA: DUF1707 domain-containing protein [Actinomycetes bacterium]|jgi:hypothetical protein|nr:DUF1707 domain-containing protein [Actinomycetes bacterium]
MANELDGLGSYRVGDAERAHTVDLLKEAHVAGYLTLAEIDERLSAALAARTRVDLERLLSDLPPEWRARHEDQRLVAPGSSAPRSAAPPAALRLLPLALVVVLVALMVVFLVRGVFFPWPLLWVWFAFGRRHRHGGWRPPDSRRVTWI